MTLVNMRFSSNYGTETVPVRKWRSNNFTRAPNPEYRSKIKSPEKFMKFTELLSCYQTGPPGGRINSRISHILINHRMNVPAREDRGKNWEGDGRERAPNDTIRAKRDLSWSTRTVISILHLTRHITRSEWADVDDENCNMNAYFNSFR